MKENEIILNERFGMGPSGLEQIDIVDGTPIFSSQKLKENLIDIFYSNKLTKGVAEDLEKLTINGYILPVYINRSKFRLFLHKTNANPIDQMVLGFYHPEKNKIYIIMDNSVNLFSYTNNTKLAKIIIHELMHFCSVNFERAFAKHFEPILTKYYTSVFDMFFGTALKKKISPAVAKEFYMFLFNEIEWSNLDKGNQLISKLSTFLQNLFETHFGKSDMLDRFLAGLISPVILYYSNPGAFISALYSGEPNSRFLIYCLFRGYKELGVKNPDTTPIQEMLYPSEVICISTDNIIPLHYSAIKKAARIYGKR